jgi:hypothetical protein
MHKQDFKRRDDAFKSIIRMVHGKRVKFVPGETLEDIGTLGKILDDGPKIMRLVRISTACFPIPSDFPERVRARAQQQRTVGIFTPPCSDDEEKLP